MNEAIHNENAAFAVSEADAQFGTSATSTEAPKPKPYTFRLLAAEDIFPMFKIIKKIGIREFKAFFDGDKFKDIASAFTGKTDATSVEAAGIEIALELADVLLNNIPNCEDDIFRFLASVSNLDEQVVRKFSLVTFAEMLIDFFKKEEFRDFMKVVSKLFK